MSYLAPSLKPRGPQLAGQVGNSYSLAMNLWNAAHDHKRHCGENCNVSLSRIEMAARKVMEHGANVREHSDFAKWEWPF